MTRAERDRAAELPGLHERQERQEAEGVLAAAVGRELGAEARAWGDGLWSVRTPGLPAHGPGNQLTGLAPANLERLEGIVPWFDAAGCSMRIRWPGDGLASEIGRRFAAAGFCADELEAWMVAPLDDLRVDAPAHDIRLATAPADLERFAEAFFAGWAVTAPLKRRVIRAALAAHPGPAGWCRYVAFVDGQPAGEAVLARFDDTAYLAEASTVPAFRRRGIHRALIARRVADARAAGCARIFGAVAYRDQSWADMRGLGLREAFMTVSFVRPAPA